MAKDNRFNERRHLALVYLLIMVEDRRVRELFAAPGELKDTALALRSVDLSFTDIFISFILAEKSKDVRGNLRTILPLLLASYWVKVRTYTDNLDKFKSHFKRAEFTGNELFEFVRLVRENWLGHGSFASSAKRLIQARLVQLAPEEILHATDRRAARETLQVAHIKPTTKIRENVFRCVLGLPFDEAFICDLKPRKVEKPLPCDMDELRARLKSLFQLGDKETVK